MAETLEEEKGCDYPGCGRNWESCIDGWKLCSEHYDEYVAECGKDEN